MAQLDRRRRNKRTMSRLGASVKPGVAALLTAGVVAGGAFGITQTGINKSFEVQLEPEIETVDQSASNEVAEPVEVFIVHVDGAVMLPGVYELTGDDLRIRDAVEAAGGLLDGADTSGVNLAAPVVDGSKVHIPTLDETAQAGAAPAASTSGSSSPLALVNINSATIDQLCTLSGIGEATARNIIADREQNGPFNCIEDLMRVSGIGEKKYARVKDQICV